MKTPTSLAMDVPPPSLPPSLMWQEQRCHSEPSVPRGGKTCSETVHCSLGRKSGRAHREGSCTWTSGGSQDAVLKDSQRDLCPGGLRLLHYWSVCVGAWVFSALSQTPLDVHQGQGGAVGRVPALMFAGTAQMPALLLPGCVSMESQLYVPKFKRPLLKQGERKTCFTAHLLIKSKHG